MYPDPHTDTTPATPASAEELAELTGCLRRWASMLGAKGDPRSAATIMSEALDLIGMASIAVPIKRLRELLGPDGAQPRRRDAI